MTLSSYIMHRGHCIFQHIGKGHETQWSYVSRGVETNVRELFERVHRWKKEAGSNRGYAGSEELGKRGGEEEQMMILQGRKNPRAAFQVVD